MTILHRLGVHRWGRSFHVYGRLWCDVGYECRLCPARKIEWEGHWENRHAEADE